jgi:hypothetical protein
MTTSTPEITPTEAAADGSTTGEAPQERSLVNIRAIARGSDLDISNALVGGAFGDRISVSRAFVRTAFGGRSLDVRQAGAGVIATAGGASIQQGGAQTILSTGTVTMRQAGSGIALARSVSVDQGGLVIFGIAPRLEVRDGGRVVFGPLPALAFIGSVAGAITIAALAIRAARGRAR